MPGKGGQESKVSEKVASFPGPIPILRTGPGNKASQKEY